MPVPINLHYSGDSASIAKLSGSFWGWGKPQSLQNGQLNLQLVPGTYEFKFNVNGQWVTCGDYPTVRTFLGEDVRNNVITVEGSDEKSFQVTSSAPTHASTQSQESAKEEDLWEEFVSVKKVDSSQAAPPPPPGPQIDPEEVEFLRNEVKSLAGINQDLKLQLQTSASKPDQTLEVQQLKSDVESLAGINQDLKQQLQTSASKPEQTLEVQQLKSDVENLVAINQQLQHAIQEAKAQAQAQTQAQKQSSQQAHLPEMDPVELNELKMEIQNLASMNQQLQQSLQAAQENADLAQQQANDAAIALSQMQAFQQPPPPQSTGMDPILFQQQEQNIAYLSSELQKNQQEMQFLKEKLAKADAEKEQIVVLNQQVESLSTQKHDLQAKLSDFKDIYAQTAFGLSPDEVNKYRAAFDLFDKNKDGRITKEEIASAIAECGLKPTAGWVQDLIQEADEDASGTIEWPEFLHAMTRHVTGHPNKPTPPTSKPQPAPSSPSRGPAAHPAGPRSPNKSGPGAAPKPAPGNKSKTPAFLQKK